MSAASVVELFPITAVAVAASMLLLWLISLATRNASIVDLFWGLGFVLIAWVSSAALGGGGTRRLVILALVTLWGLRLTAYLAWRNLGKGEDFRYGAMRERRGRRFPLVSLGTVFLLQGTLMWVVSLPVQAGMAHGGGLGPAAWLGVAVWAVGLAFEALGDLQLARFKADPANTGAVMDRGLWRYTRHPNYFGDFCVWWGIYLVALTTETWWSGAGPALMTFLLLRFSGVAHLERTISKRRPGYEEYARRTNAFFPGRPREA